MQNATTILEACIFATVICGFFGIILKQNPVANIISTEVMSTGAIADYVLVAACGGLFTPIVSDDREVAYADPIPQAVILTAIAIGFSIEALTSVGAIAPPPR